MYVWRCGASWEAKASAVWLAGWLAESLSARLKPLPGHSTGAVLDYEWYCIVWALPIPALLNGFNHWFRFSYTVLVESVPLPPLWTPWFPRLTCLEAAVEMSCRPSHGPDTTFTLIGKKTMTWVGIKPEESFFNHHELPMWWNTTVWWRRTLKWRMRWFTSDSVSMNEHVG